VEIEPTVNQISMDELSVLELKVPAVDNKPMTYLEALSSFLKFSDEEALLLINLPGHLGNRLARESVREWVQLLQNRSSLPTTEASRLGPDILWQLGYKIPKSFKTSGSTTIRTFLAIDPHDRLSVVKYSDQEGFEENGIPWLRKEAARMEEYRFYLGHHVPAVFDRVEVAAQDDRDSAFFYSMEYRPFETLSEYLLYDPAATGQEFFRRLDVALNQQVEMLYDQPDTWISPNQQGENSYVQTFYLDKFKQRLALLTDPINHTAAMFASLIHADTLTINGIPYTNLPRLLELLDIHKDRINQIEPKLLGLAHGDGHLGNMGFEIGKPIENGLVLFDLRGVDLSTRMDIAYDIGKLAFSFLHALVDRTHALTVPVPSLEVNEETKEVSARLEFDASQIDKIILHIALRNQLEGFLQNHQPLVAVLRKMGEESETWLARAKLTEAMQLLGIAPDRLEDDPSGGTAMTYYVLSTLVLNGFLRSVVGVL